MKAYVRDITSGMKKALANREETLKVVSEVAEGADPGAGNLSAQGQ